MRLPHFRIRALMSAVIVVALILWGTMMGSRAYRFHRLAQTYADEEYGLRQAAALKGTTDGMNAYRTDCIEYFAILRVKYRRAVWHPWEPVAPNPHAPVHPYLK